MSPNRLEAFSDGVFAIAFFTIGIIWINHHAIFGRLRAVDHSILIWNLAVLLTVGVLPFTTELMATYLKESSGEGLAAAICAGCAVYYSLPIASRGTGGQSEANIA